MTDPGDARAEGAGAGPEPDADELVLALAHAERLATGERAHGDADPAALRVHDALDRTRADLARHGDELVRDAPAMPPAVLARLDRALAAERARPAPEPSAEARRPRRARALVVAVAAAALLVMVLVAGVVLGPVPGGTGPSDVPAPRAGGAPDRVEPGPGPAPGAPELAAADVGDVAVALRAGLGRADYGPLADPFRRAGCLAAHGVPPGVVPAGARQVVLEGRPAVLFVLTTGVAARFRVLVVDGRCAADAPLTLADRVVGR